MSSSMIARFFVVTAVICAAALAAAADSDTVAVRFFSDGSLVLAQRAVPPGMAPAEAAIRALVAGPTQDEAARGWSSAIPAGTSVVQAVVNADSAEIDLSPEVLSGLDEAALAAIFDQFKSTLGDFPSIGSIRLTCGGQPLASYLPPAPQVGQPASLEPRVSGVGLSGKKICVGPSHGRFWNGSGWYWQRSDPCGFGEAVLEDTNSIRLVQYLKQYLVQDGAVFTSPRQLDESDCCNSDTGLAWWKMCAQTWLHHIGAPCSVWASYSGNCGADTAVSRSSDDIRARPLYADSVGADIYIAHHTNAGGGGTATGTETFRDTAMEHPEYETASYNLASAVQNAVVSTIRSTFPEEPSWANRGVKDSAGGFGEIRIPSRPAILIELAFHDDCSRDALYLKDDFFRSVAEWGIYKGICDYFGNTPTWDKYSDEYVSDTIPTTMLVGETRNVSVTFRNRGVCWQSSRGFKLGAVGDSDPFTSTTRVNVSGTIKPGSTCTFNFTLTAPTTPGSYVTDWRMVRDGYAWFGATVSKTINVLPNNDGEAPTVPTNLHVTAVTTSSVSLAWNPSTDNYGVLGYRVFRNGVQVGTTATTSYTDTGLADNTTYTYQVDAYDSVPNYSAKSTPVSATTVAIIFQDGFANLNNWTLDSGVSGNVMPTYSTAQNHGSISGAGSAYLPLGAPHFVYHDVSSSLTSGGYKTGTLSGWMYDVSGAVSGLRIALRAYLYDSSGSWKTIYWIGAYNGNPPNIATHYIGATYSGGWTYYDLGTRSVGWHKLAMEILPYTGSNDLKFYVDDVLQATVSQPSLAANACIRRIYFGYNYNVNQDTYWDDIMFQSMAPAAPSNLVGTALSATSIRWTYTDNANNEIGYRLYDGATKVREIETPNTTTIDETSLQPNTNYTRTVKAYAGVLESVGVAASATTLSAPPTLATVICDKPVGVQQTTNDFTFTAVGGFGPGTVDHYLVAWDQQPTHTWTGAEPEWSSGNLVRYATASPLGWYLHVKGYNSASIENGTLDIGPFYYGVPGPDVTSVTDDGDWTASTTELHAAWSATPVGHDIGGYEVAIGTTPLGTQILNWTDVGAETEATIEWLNLAEGPTYYISVRATDVLGNTGNPASSDGIRVAPLAAKISDAKVLSAGAPCRLLGKAVVGVFDGRVYLEETDRSCGIAVVTNATPVPGDKLDVAGVLSGTSEERSILANYTKNAGSGAVIEPVFMVVGRVGGSAFGPAPGGVGGVGLNNAGLLVCVSGLTSGRNPATGEFTVSDGSGSIKVVAPGVTPPADGAFVRVVGVARLDSTLTPFISRRLDIDIRQF